MLVITPNSLHIFWSLNILSILFESSKILLIYYRFFDKYNHTISLFEKFKGIPVEQLNENPVFKRHALAILRAIDSVIVNLDDDSKVKDGLIALGRMHMKRNVSEQNFLVSIRNFFRALYSLINLINYS